MISFLPFQAEYLADFRRWLSADHIRPAWQETDDPEKLQTKLIEEMPRRGVHCFVIVVDGARVGFIQYYDAKRVGGGWWEQEKPGVFGVDLLIGEAALLGRGLGPKAIREFLGFVRAREPSVTEFIIDPAPSNQRAIRAFEKAGFVREGEITTPGGPALLMRMKL